VKSEAPKRKKERKLFSFLQNMGKTASER
jgi:hypothetical protein